MSNSPSDLESRFSQLQETQLALAKSEQMFRQFAEIIDDVFWRTSPEFDKVIYVSPAYEKIWGTSVLTLYKDALEWLAPILKEDRPGVEAELKRLIKDHNTIAFQYRIRRPDGNIRLIYSKGFCLKDDKGTVINLIGVASDITDYVQNEKRQALLKKIDTVLKSSPLLQVASHQFIEVLCDTFNWEYGEIWLLDELTSILTNTNRFFNASSFIPFADASANMTFKVGEGLPGTIVKKGGPLYVKNYPEEYQSSRTNMATELGLEQAVAFPLMYQNKILGVMVFFFSHHSPYDDKYMELLKTLGTQIGQYIENQITHEKVVLAQKSSQLKSEFLANMSHELRTPLNAIIGFSELMFLEKTGPVSPEHKEYLGDILTSANHLLALINDILDLSKVEAGKMTFYPQKVDLQNTIQDVCDILRALTANKNLKVSLHIDPSINNVCLDPQKFKQVLYNLLSNAIKFTPPKGNIEIRVLPEANHCFRLEVQDNGIGIKTDAISALFKEFQQVQGPSENPEGTGLGLALIRRIVEAQGGQVGVNSIEGKGSTFFIILPQEALTPPQ